MRPRRPRNLPPIGRPPAGAGGFETQLQMAHQHFARGEFVRAGFLFEELATVAARRGGPRAPLFFLQASRAFFHASEPEKAIQLARGAYSAWQARPLRSPAPALVRLADEADQLGYPGEAQTLRGWLPELPDIPAPESSPITAKEILRLPTQCPSCGGPVYPDEVEWMDERTARCDFCANPLSAN